MKTVLRLGVLAVLSAIGFAAFAGGGHPQMASAATPGTTLTVVVSDASTDTHQFFVAMPECGTTTDHASLKDTESDTFVCDLDTENDWTLTITSPTGNVLDSVTCVATDEEGQGSTPNLQSDISAFNDESIPSNDDTYAITMTDGEDITCTFTFLSENSNGGGGSGIPVETGSPLDPDGDGFIEFVAIAVTADPNVIPCGGTANLTASARTKDAGLVVPPNLIGFHWSTDVGVLNVGPPNTADETDNRATLTLLPGMTSATVKVWVGDLSDQPGEVTIQQFCPEVVTDGSGATGSIQLSASSQTAGCGEAIFVGARIRDSKNQVPAEGTDVRFLASAGVFQIDAGVTTTYGNEEPSQALTTVSQYNTATNKSGVLNITYLAPLYGGDAVITAASGDKFAKLTIHVACAAAPPAAVASAGGTGGGGSSCTPIGDGVCIPGNGSVSIRPPNTGDAGLK